MSNRILLADAATVSASEQAVETSSSVVVKKPEPRNNMLVDDQRCTYLPLGGPDDPRVVLLSRFGTPASVMAPAWRCAMRVQSAVQNSLLEATGSRALGDGDDSERDEISAVFVGLAIGIGLAARNGRVSPEGFSTLVKIARETANVIRIADDLRRLAEANGHGTADTTIN